MRRVMIYDGLSKLNRYRGLYKGLDVLIDWLDSHDMCELPLGTNEIDGKRVFANVMIATTRYAQDAHYEWHRRYMDLQVDLEGEECFKVTPGPVIQIAEFNEQDDFQLADATEGADVIDGTLAHGRFALFVAGEPHMPTLTVPGATPAAVKKICFKVLGDKFWDE